MKPATRANGAAEVAPSLREVRARVRDGAFAALGDELLALRHGGSLGQAARSRLAAVAPDPADGPADLPAARALGTWLGRVELALRERDPSVRTLRDGLRAIVGRLRADTPPPDREHVAGLDADYLAGLVGRGRRAPLDEFMSVLESLALVDAMLSDVESAVGRAKARTLAEEG